MEPAEASVIIPTRLVQLSERFKPRYMGGIADEAVFRDVSLGWFAVFEGSWEALFVGETKPDWESGEEIEIVIRKRKHAKS